MSSFTIYEHNDYGGARKTINLDSKALNQVYSFDQLGFNDKTSSIRWDLETGKKLILYSDAEGQGNKYGVINKGENPNLSNQQFNDKISSYRFIINNTVPEYFDVVSSEPKVIKFSTNGVRQGTDRGTMNEHFQGICVIDDKHMIITTSDFNGAYFFIVKWKNGFLSGETGVMIKDVWITNDFPGLEFDHCSGIQILDDIVAIGLEYIDGEPDVGEPASSIVFYNLQDRANPKRTGPIIRRMKNGAATTGLVRLQNSLLLVVGGTDTQDLDFYQTGPGQTDMSNAVFAASPINWEPKSANKDGWVDPNWGERYQGVNLLKDADGKLYLAGFNDPGMIGKNWVDLYAVELPGTKPVVLKKLSRKSVEFKGDPRFECGSSIYRSANNRIHFVVIGDGRKKYEPITPGALKLITTIDINYFT